MGAVFRIAPIAPIEENTVRIPAGAITFGLEMRELNAAVVDGFYAERPDEETVRGLVAERDELDDGGASIHVFGTEDALEYLRFDCFDKEPHYHYVHPHEDFQVVHAVDPVALGDPFEWALTRLRTRLAEMLRESGGAPLADRIEPAVVEQALSELITVKTKASA